MRLRTKILVSMGLTILIVLGVSTIFFIRMLNGQYQETVQWRSEALAQGLIGAMTRAVMSSPAGLAEINQECENLYQANKAKDLTQVAVIDPAGEFVCHSESALRGSVVTSEALKPYLRQDRIAIVREGTIYHTLLPVFTQEQTYLGMIDLGFPRATIVRKIQQLLWQIGIMFGGFLATAFCSTSLLMRIFVTKPIGKLVEIGEDLAKGQVGFDLKSTSNDEIAAIGKVFTRISIYMQYVTYIASLIATGEIDRDIRVRSEQDVMGNALQNMLHYLQEVASVAKRVAAGDLTQNIIARSTSDTFGQVIQTMTEGLRALIQQIRKSASQLADTGNAIAALSIRDMNIVHKVETSVDDMVLSTLVEVEESAKVMAEDMETLASATQETSVSVTQMTASISRIASSTEELNQQTQHTIVTLNEAVSELDAVVEDTEISKTLSQNTIQDALEGEQAVEQVMTSMEAIQAIQDTTVNAITSLAHRSDEISSIVDVIHEIADQTSLLALNASIIAAQAGVQGRGFAVIADEIKELAGRVTASTKNIIGIVNLVHQETATVVQMIHQGVTNVHQGVERTQSARDILHKIIESAKRSSTLVTDIAAALEKQMTISHLLAADMAKVQEKTTVITTETKEQKISTFQIKQAIDAILDMAGRTQEATTRQRNGVQNVIDLLNDVAALIYMNLESSQKVAQTADELASQSETLLQSINQFVL